MTDLKVEVDPAEVGLDAERLGRIEQHFRAYVDDGRLPGWLAVVARHGKIAYVAHHGRRDVEAGAPVETDTIWRIYSMTKPITSLALMMLYEQGAFDLRDPVEGFIPSFADASVFSGGTAAALETVPAEGPVRIWHLLTHSSGLSYGQTDHPVDARYREADAAVARVDPSDLAASVDGWAAQPLLFQPGSHWNYSRATDVVGRLVEVISGQSLDAFFAEHILGPLQMTDTAFVVDDSREARMASLYVPDPETRRAVPAAEPRARRSTPFLSGGGGLYSTVADYHRFCQLLLGGGVDGVRLIGPRTLRTMATNQLRGGLGLGELSFGGPSEIAPEGMGFGLGFSVVLDPARTKVSGSRGEFGWGGAASTAFWIDPREQLTALFFTQLRPSSTWPIRPRLHQLISQAIVEPAFPRGRTRA